MHAAGAYVNANVTALQTGYLLHQTISISVQIHCYSWSKMSMTQFSYNTGVLTWLYCESLFLLECVTN